MSPAAPPARPTDRPRTTAPALAVVHARLDAVLARIRLLRVSAGLARVVWQAAAVAVLLYALDRWLVLPRGVRGALLVLAGVLGAQLLARRVLRPLFRGPGRLEAARVVERARPEFEGRIVSALQLRGGPEGSLERKVVDEAAERCQGEDLRRVLVARPSLAETWRAAGALAVLALLVLLGKPHADVFLRRWTLHDVGWPRDVRLALRVAPRGPAHVVSPDGTLVAARGGVVEADASVQGADPGRVELVLEGSRGERASSMTAQPDGDWRGRLEV